MIEIREGWLLAWPWLLLALPLPDTLALTWAADMAPAASCAVYWPMALAASRATCACCTAFCIFAWYSVICISA